MFTGGSQFALVSTMSDGGSGAAGAATAILLGSAATRCTGLRLSSLLRVRGRAEGRDRAARDRRVDRDGDRPGHRPRRPARLLHDRASRCSCCGTSRRLIGGARRADARRSRRRTGSMRPRRPRSSRCSRRGCGRAQTWDRRDRWRDGRRARAHTVRARRASRCCAPRSSRSIVGWRGRPLMWAAVIVGSLGCYAFKLAGLSVPRARARAPRASSASPSSCRSRSLAALDRHADVRRRPPPRRSTRAFAGLLVAIVLVWRRAPFLRGGVRAPPRPPPSSASPR